MIERSERIPDSEQIEPTGAEPLRRNSVSVEQIQDADLRTYFCHETLASASNQCQFLNQTKTYQSCLLNISKISLKLLVQST